MHSIFHFDIGAVFQPFTISGLNSDEDSGTNSDSNSDLDYDLDQTDVNDYEPVEKSIDSSRTYPVDKRKEIVEYWRGSKGKKSRSLRQVQHRYTKVASITQLYRWESQLANGE